MATFLGIDCGATNLRIGFVDKAGKLLSSKKLPSPLRYQPENFAQIIKDQVRGQAFDDIGIGVPGPLDFKKGLILPSSNLGNITPIPILTKFEMVFNRKIYLDRDTNVALIGEAWVGGAKGLKEVVMITLGTGVGGAIMVEGKIERGEGGMAGELGHMYIEIENLRFKIENLPRCGLGHEGCLEAMINSAKGLDDLATYLGYGLASIVDIFNPQKIIIGGGKMQFGLSAVRLSSPSKSDWRSDFLPAAIRIMKQKGVKPPVDKVQVSYAKLGEWSGVYGAARLAMI